MKVLEIIKKYWKELLIIIAALFIAFLMQSNKALKEDNQRLSTNYYAMCDSAKEFKTKNGYYAAKTSNMEVTIDELCAKYSDAQETIKDLNIKIRKLEQYQKGIIEKTIHDTITLHDTVVNNVAMKSGNYSVNCTDIDFLLNNDILDFKLQTKDEIDILISIEKEGKWWQFWKFPRKKNYVTTATSKCPDTKVTVNSCKIKK